QVVELLSQPRVHPRGAKPKVMGQHRSAPHQRAEPPRSAPVPMIFGKPPRQARVRRSRQHLHDRAGLVVAMRVVTGSRGHEASSSAGGSSKLDIAGSGSTGSSSHSKLSVVSRAISASAPVNESGTTSSPGSATLPTSDELGKEANAASRSSKRSRSGEGF